MDAVSDRDFEIEFLNALTLVAIHLSRLSEDVVIYASSEFGFVVLPDTFATGSSAMPQKKNPDLFELLRGKTGRVLGAAMNVLVTVKGLPLAYNRDLQETQEPLFAASDSVFESLRIVTEFFNTVQFDTERMQRAASTGFLNATAAANYLVKRGVPFRRAHAIVGQIVRHCLEKGCDIAALSTAELKQFSREFDQDVKTAIDLPTVIAEHDVVGGTSPARVRQAIESAAERVARLREAISAHA
jgi:argininosuccinate lyase